MSFLSCFPRQTVRFSGHVSVPTPGHLYTVAQRDSVFHLHLVSAGSTTTPHVPNPPCLSLVSICLHSRIASWPSIHSARARIPTDGAARLEPDRPALAHEP